jgi:drug/metabolite transporter (DMT)-like permease
LSARRENTIGVLCLVGVALCWGFVASTVKRLSVQLNPYTISFFRVSMAAVVSGGLFALQKGDWRRLPWFVPWMLVGALGRAGNYVAYNVSLEQMPSNVATVTAPVQTVAVIWMARLFLGERARDRWLGLTLSLVGMALLWWNGQDWEAVLDPRYVWGNLLMVLAGLGSAVQYMSQKVLSSRWSSLGILFTVFAWNAAIHLPFAWASGGLSRAYDSETWMLVLFLGLVLTAGSYYLLAEGYRRCAATTAVTITNTTIFLTLVWSALLLRERVSAIMVVGALLVVAGAVAVVVADRRATRRAKEGVQSEQAV